MPPAGPRPSTARPRHFDGSGVELRFAAQPAGFIDARDVPDADGVVVATSWETAEWALALPESKGARAYFVQHHEGFDWLPVSGRGHLRPPLHKIVRSAPWLVDA